MNDVASLASSLEAKLKEVGLPFETLKVFGRLRLNVHVTCVSPDTALNWQALLKEVTGASPTVTGTSWRAKRNKGTCLLPTMRHGYLVAVVGA